VVNTIEELNKYPWSGHRALLGNATAPFQACDQVLLFFAHKERQARGAYRRFVEQGVSQGHRSEFTGGGLKRSLGSTINRNDRVLTDERILGTGEFVKQIVEKATSHSPIRRERIERMKEMIQARCAAENINPDALKGGSRKSPLPRVRSELTSQIVSELGVSYAEVGRNLGITTSGVCRIMSRMRKST
jgi:hypothetical protein